MIFKLLVNQPPAICWEKKSRHFVADFLGSSFFHLDRGVGEQKKWLNLPSIAKKNLEEAQPNQT